MVALSDVTEVATRHISAERTAALIVGVGAIVGVIVALENYHFTLGNPFPE